MKKYIDSTDIKLDIAIENFLERRGYEHYDIQNIEIEYSKDIEFIKISHITYDREKSDTDLNLIDFQQLLSAIASKSRKFVYLIEGSIDGISLYLGAKGKNSFLKDTFEGVYAGSKLTRSTPLHFNNMKYSKAMLGIPTLKRDADKAYKQSLERILFPLQGKKFRLILLAESYRLETIQEIISNYRTLGNEIHKLVKQGKTHQESYTDTEGIVFTVGSSTSRTEGKSESNSDSYGHSDRSNESKIGTTFSTAIGAGMGFLVGGSTGMVLGAGMGGSVAGNLFAKTESENHSRSKTENLSRTDASNQSKSSNINHSKTKMLGLSYDEINKSAEHCEKLIDTYIKRFQKGLNHGMWNSSLYIQAENQEVLSELEHTLKSIYSGDDSHYEPIRFTPELQENTQINISKLPMIYFNKNILHPIHNSFLGFSSAINTEELSILSALPNSDVDGISVSKISTFGLTQSPIKKGSISLGKILNKKKPTSQNFLLSTEALNGHLFVSGITGSGKSNTIKSILSKTWKNHKIPFLVIEPAKSEYQFMQKEIPKLQIFKLGRANDIFRFNPFVFDYKKNHQYTVLNHIDSIKSSFSAAFPMYGSMPYILEEAIQKIYEEKGWNLLSLEHPAFDETVGLSNEFNRMLFPKMNDLMDAITSIVEGAGYHNELQSNIKAALITRIKNLTIGAKGTIFGSSHAIESQHLFEKPTIIELSSIINGEEKSFIMGLILNALYRYRESFGMSNQLEHLVVIEEAHRLLPNIPLEQSMENASAKASSVEFFTNMLAESRALGQGIIIADQVANKLHSDVIKNTNVKILHRTMAKDDRYVVGNSINLNENQILDIAELETGEAVVHSKDIHQAFLVKIDAIEESKDVDVKKFQEAFLEEHTYYRYTFPFEDKFYTDFGLKYLHNHREYVSNINNQKALLQVITQALLGNKKQMLSHWELIEDTNIYLLVKIFSKFEPLNSISNYKKPYYFKKMYQSVVELFLTLISNDDIEVAMKNMQKSFLHKKIKNIYASMLFYPEDSVDFSFLLQSLFQYNPSLLEEMNEQLPLASKNRSDLIQLLTYISKSIFHTEKPLLIYSLLAMRYGNKEENLTALVKELY